MLRHGLPLRDRLAKNDVKGKGRIFDNEGSRPLLTSNDVRGRVG